MAGGYVENAKVYTTESLGKFSIRDMLDYFAQRGAMRVSDLHIKVGTTPYYRVDGQLVRLKGERVTPQIAKQLIYPILHEKNITELQEKFSFLSCEQTFKYSDLYPALRGREPGGQVIQTIPQSFVDILHCPLPLSMVRLVSSSA